MNTIDFTQDGGMPFTQMILAHQQAAMAEVIQALTHVAGTGPYIIYGMNPTGGGVVPTVINDGYFVFDEEVVFWSAQTVPAYVPSVSKLLVDVQSVAVALALPYQDGSIPDVVIRSVPQFVVVPLAQALTPTQFLFSDLTFYHIALGVAGKDAAWQSINVSIGAGSGGISGTLQYKRNYINNTIQVKGALTANNPANLNAPTAATYVLMGTLASGYRPASIAPFVCSTDSGSLNKTDAGSTDYLRSLVGMVDTGGRISIAWVKPLDTSTAFVVNVNVTIPLD